ncbi:MAG: hypothetical protein AAGH15_26365 [Myxococcota bacterium]
MKQYAIIPVLMLSACAAPEADPNHEVVIVRRTVGDEAPPARARLTRTQLAKLAPELRAELREHRGPYAVRVDFDDAPTHEVLQTFFLRRHGDGFIGRIDRESLKDLIVREDVVRVSALRAAASAG